MADEEVQEGQESPEEETAESANADSPEDDMDSLMDEMEAKKFTSNRFWQERRFEFLSHGSSRY